MSSADTRKSDLDFLRVAAIVAVVIIHCIATVVLQRQVGGGAWIVGNVIDSFMRWCVPVFVMISGALLIKPAAFSESKRFYKKRLARILLPILIWPLVYLAWTTFALDAPLDLHQTIKSYLTGTPVTSHLYFLFLIAGLYLLTPVISLYATSVTRRQFTITTITVLLATTVWFSLASLLSHHNHPLNIITQGLPYVGYFMLGYALRDVTVKRLSIPASLFAASGTLMAIASYITASTYGATAKAGLFFYSYPSILAIFISVAAFFTGRGIYYKITEHRALRRHAEKIDSGLSKLAFVSFGVYLTHIIVLQALAKLFSIDETLVTYSLLLTAGTIVISFIVSAAMLRIPVVRNTIQ